MPTATYPLPIISLASWLFISATMKLYSCCRNRHSLCLLWWSCGFRVLILLLHTVKHFNLMVNCWVIPTNITSPSIQQPKSPLWFGVLKHRKYSSIFILLYLAREKCGECLSENICFLCWATFHLNIFETWRLRNIHTKRCYCLGSNTIFPWKQMLLCQYSGNSVMKCRDGFLKNIFKGFNSHYWADSVLIKSPS